MGDKPLATIRNRVERGLLCAEGFATTMVPGRSSGRRDVLRSLASAGLLPVAGCSVGDTDPSIDVPTDALTDEPVTIGIDGLEPGSSVLLRAGAESRDGTTWESCARFEVGDAGHLSVPDRAPAEGTYAGADAMGPFWSMRPLDTGSSGPLDPETLFVPRESGYDVDLAAEVDGETVTEATTTRRLFDPDIERRPTSSGGSSRRRATGPRRGSSTSTARAGDHTWRRGGCWPRGGTRRSSSTTSATPNRSPTGWSRSRSSTSRRPSSGSASGTG